MFGFNNTPRSVAIDYSFFGGAEELPPWLRPLASSSKSDTAKQRRASSSRSSSFSSAGANGEETSASTSGSTIASTPDTSEHEEDDEVQAVKRRAAEKQLAAVSESEDVQINHAGSSWLPKLLPQPQEQADFLWLLTEEPHRSRRQAILKAHPEVRKLMGRESMTKWIASGVVMLQLAVMLGIWNWGWHPLDWKFLLTAYAIGGTANQNIFLAVHEITHNLAFKGIKANKVFAVAVNAVIGVPYAMMFKQYHIEHHKHLGEDGIDTDMPTKLELMCLRNVLGKAFFATFQIFFYALRPGFIKTQRLTPWHLLNIGFQLAFNYLVVTRLGWQPMLYLLESSFFAGSLHPCAAHFIAEHYLFGNIAQETWSYYGPLNILAYNVGYHNEHHDFPSVPWTKLPELKAMAPEFYDCLPHHTSWPMVTVQFILGTDSGLFARIKRKAKEGAAAALGTSAEEVEEAQSSNAQSTAVSKNGGDHGAALSSRS